MKNEEKMIEKTYSCNAWKDVCKGAIAQGRREGGLGSGVGPEVGGTCRDDPYEGGGQATEEALDTCSVLFYFVRKCVRVFCICERERETQTSIFLYIYI